MSKDLYAMALTVGQQSASMDGYLQAVSTIPGWAGGHATLLSWSMGKMYCNMKIYV